MNRRTLVAITALSLGCSFYSHAQERRAHYEQSNQLRERFADKYRPAIVQPRWVGPDTLWYQSLAADGTREYFSVDGVKGVRTKLFEPKALAESLELITGKPVDASGIPIEDVAPSGPEVLLLLGPEGRTYRLTDDGKTLSEVKDPGDSPFHLKPLKRVRSSQTSGGTSTAIYFINLTQRPLDLQWIDGDGKAKSYGQLNPGERRRQHTFSGHVWAARAEDDSEVGVYMGTGRPAIAAIGAPIAAESTAQESQDDRPRNPRGRRAEEGKDQTPAQRQAESRLFIRDHNVWMKGDSKDESSKEVQLTTDGSADNSYGGKIHVSPDASRAVVIQTAKGGDRKVHYVQSSPKDQLQPKLHWYEYLKPGDEIPTPRPKLFDLVEKREIQVSTALMPTPWAINHFHWEADSSRFTFLYNQRGHRVMRLLAIEAQSGNVSAIIDEAPATFFDYAGKTFVHRVAEKGQIIWMSERSGYNHLYLIDSKTGSLINPITSGNWVVRSVDKVDDSSGTVHFRALGVYPDQDPYFLHFGRVQLDGSGLVWLTSGNGTHEVTLSPSGEYLIDTYSRADLPPVSELRRVRDGSLVLELDRSRDEALKSAGWRAPQPFQAKGRDGTTDIWGLIHRPTHFDTSKKYPVIEAIYAGPHGFHVPKAFNPFSQAATMAELGFIVVQIDGMGTNWRSKAFHDVAWKNLRDGGFPDRIAWMTAAAKAHPEIDLENDGRGVGIYGGSAGGQNALAALIWHGDFYKAAAADCGCHDNRMDKIWWNELWMSWPVGSHYEDSSNVVHAKKLRDDANLLLTVGEMDENVDPASTMQVVAALIEANRQFDLLVVPNAGHGAGESPYARRRRQDFFVKHIMGVTPERPSVKSSQPQAD